MSADTTLCGRFWASTLLAALYTVPGPSASPNKAINGRPNSGNMTCGSLILPNLGDVTQAAERSTNTALFLLLGAALRLYTNILRHHKNHRFPLASMRIVFKAVRDSDLQGL